MVSPNWENESYTPSPREQCCRCGEQLGEAGAYYWGIIRVCQECYHEEMDQQNYERLQDYSDFADVLNVAGWAAVCVAGAAIVACAVHLFLK